MYARCWQAAGSPPLWRCDLRAWCSKTLCFLQGFVAVEDPKLEQWRNAQTMGFTRVVSVMRAARTCIIGISLVMGPCQRKICTPR